MITEITFGLRNISCGGCSHYLGDKDANLVGSGTGEVKETGVCNNPKAVTFGDHVRFNSNPVTVLREKGRPTLAKMYEREGASCFAPRYTKKER